MRHSDERDWVSDVHVGGQRLSWHFKELKLLEESREEDVELLLCQRLTKAVALSDTKRDHFFIRNELAL